MLGGVLPLATVGTTAVVAVVVVVAVARAVVVCATALDVLISKQENSQAVL